MQASSATAPSWPLEFRLLMGIRTGIKHHSTDKLGTAKEFCRVISCSKVGEDQTSCLFDYFNCTVCTYVHMHVAAHTPASDCDHVYNPTNSRNLAGPEPLGPYM